MLGISFVRGLIRLRMALNFPKRSQEKMGKPRCSVELIEYFFRDEILLMNMTQAVELNEPTDQ